MKREVFLVRKMKKEIIKFCYEKVAVRNSLNNVHEVLQAFLCAFNIFESNSRNGFILFNREALKLQLS